MSHGGIYSSNGPGELAVPSLAYKHGHYILQLQNTLLILGKAMKRYFLRRTEEWEHILENTDRPEVLCPDKRKVIFESVCFMWGIKNIQFQ